MRNAFCKMYITICGRFRLNEDGVAGYGNRMKAKYTVNWGVQIAGMIFQTRSSIPYFQMTFYRLFFYTIKFSVIMCFSMILSSYLVPRSLLLLRLCCVFFFKPFILNYKHLLFIKYCVLTRPFIITNPSASV